MSSSLSRFAHEVADGYVLGPVRAALGVLLGWQALTMARELASGGYFGDAFHISMLPSVLVPSHRLTAVIVALRLCFAVMTTIGVWARPALATSAVLGLWLLFCDRLQFSHATYSLFCFSFLLSLGPCDRSWRATESLEPRTGPFWAIRLAQVQISIVYLASGGAKLLEPDWRSGAVLADRIARGAGAAVAAGIPRGVVDWLARPDSASALAKLAITTEILLCVALWLRPTRVIALFWGLWFHAAVFFVTMRAGGGDTNALLTLAMYGLFATPDYHARKLRYDPSRPWGKVVGAFVPMFDWLGRFEVKPWEPDGNPGHSIVVERRDGTKVTGIRAFAMLTRCLPVLFPMWAPVALVASFTRQGDLTTGG